MSVDKVQFNAWLATQPDNVKNAKTKEQKALFEAKQVKDKLDGLTNVAQGKKTEVPTPEESARKIEARKAREAEIAEAKKINGFQPTVLDDDERALAEKARTTAAVNDPLYKSSKAKRALKEDIRKSMEAPARAIYEKALEGAKPEDRRAIRKEYKAHLAMIKRGAKAQVRDIALGDKMEHTRVYESGFQKRTGKELLGDEADGLRFRVHNQRFIGKDNANLTNIRERDGVTAHEAALDIADDVSGDRYFEPNEAKNYAAKSSSVSSHDKAAKRELEKLGFGVKDDTWKNIGKGVGVATLSALGGGALPVIVDAYAHAIVSNSVTGEVLAEATDSAHGKFYNWKGGAIGGVVGGAAAAAIFGKTEDEDMLHGVGVQELFTDVKTKDGSIKAFENMSFGDKGETQKVKMVLQAINDLKLTDEEKTAFLQEAAGKNGQQILSKKELVLAYMKAASKAQEKPLTEAPVEVKPEAPKPKEPIIEIIPTEEVIQKDTVIPTYGYERKAGEYWFGIAQNMYLNPDGNPIDSKTALAIARKMKQAYSIANKSADMPKTLQLDQEIEIDGKKYKLMDTSDPSKFKRTVSNEASDGKTIKSNRNLKTKVKATEYGFEATVNGEKKAEQRGFETPQARDVAGAQAKDSLEDVYGKVKK